MLIESVSESVPPMYVRKWKTHYPFHGCVATFSVETGAVRSPYFKSSEKNCVLFENSTKRRNVEGGYPLITSFFALLLNSPLKMSSPQNSLFQTSLAGDEMGFTSNLTNSISDPKGSYLTAAKDCRRYGAVVQTTTKIGGNADSCSRRIYYEVGRHNDLATAALARSDDTVIKGDATFPTSNVLCEDFSGLAKKFSNFSGSFSRTNLAGVVERIAKALACSATYANVTTATMRAGQVYRVVALNTLGSPISASEDSVFIPRLVDSIMSPDVFAVIASAVTGEGSQVVTDVVTLNSSDNCPIVHEVKGHALAKACVDALRLLGANFAASDAGDLFSYALTRGIHSVVSVVGHTDEGAIMRSLLRRSGFSSPFGGIHYGLSEYVGLPALNSTAVASIGGYVDAIALKTAALVAHCDPGVTFNGNWFPTVLIAGSTNRESHPGDHEAVAVTAPKKDKGKSKQASTDAGASTGPSIIEADEPQPDPSAPSAVHYIKQNRGSLQQVFGPFATAYCGALAKLFGFFSSSGIAARHFQSAPAMLSDYERHLAYVSVSPFYWIEPTSLIPHDFTGLIAETEGFAAYASVGAPRELSAFEECHEYGRGSSAYSYYVVKMRGARASPFLAHWNGNPANGLSNIKIKQLDPNAIIHPGAMANAQLVRDRVEQNATLNNFLWTRGQSPFAAPGEFLNIAGAMGFMVNHLNWDDEGDLTMNHVPQHHEFKDTTVSFYVSSPSGLKSGPSNVTERDCRRARTRATRELAAASLRCQAFGSAEVVEMPTLTSTPTLPSARAAVRFTTPASQGSVGTSGQLAQTASGVTEPATAHANAAAAPVVMQHNPHKAPVLQRGVGVTTAPQNPVAAGHDLTQEGATPVASTTSASSPSAGPNQTSAAGEAQ